MNPFARTKTKKKYTLIKKEVDFSHQNLIKLTSILMAPKSDDILDFLFDEIENVEHIREDKIKTNIWLSEKDMINHAIIFGTSGKGKSYMTHFFQIEILKNSLIELNKKIMALFDELNTITSN